MAKKFFLTVILILFPLLKIYGKEGKMNFVDIFRVTNISMDDGMSHNFVEDLYCDKDGFIWIATSGSLARYDGYDFMHFSTNSINRHLKSNFVRKVTEDGFERLWVVSDGGIDVIDLTDLTIKEPIDKTGQMRQISSKPCGYIFRDSKGDLWIHCEDEIIAVRLDENGAIANIAGIKHGNQNNPLNIPIKSPQGATEGVIAAIKGEICNLKYDGSKIKAESLDIRLVLPPNLYINDYLYVKDELWIASDDGLYRFNPQNGEIRIYHPDTQKGSLSQNFISNLAMLPGEILVAGTLNGLNIFYGDNEGFLTVKASDINPSLQTLNNDFINCMLVCNGELWVGTEGNGINLYSPKHLFAKLISHRRTNPQSLSPNPVNAIFEDSDGNLWIGTVEGGLNLYNQRERSFTHFTAEKGNLSHNSVSAISADRNGKLWVGTWGGGVNVIDRNNPGKLNSIINATTDGSLRFDFIGSINYDPFNNLMWIGASNGVFIYDLNTKEIKLPFTDALKVTGTAGAIVSPDGFLWMGGTEGLFKINLKKDKHEKEFCYERQPFKLDKPENGSRERITCVALSNNGTLWVGTNGNGVYKRTMKDGKAEYTNISSRDGLPNDIAHGIAEDLQGNIWIATYHGLTCLTPQGEFINFDKRNGLETEQFYWNATTRLANGELMFGSVDGILSVRGIMDPRPVKPLEVKFTSLKAGDSVFYGHPTLFKMHQEDKNLEIGFSALDFSGRHDGKYYYLMDGFDKDWKELNKGQHNVVYTNLAHGDYTLKVKYVKAGQSFENAPVSEFNLEITPKFYRQSWFILSMLLMCLLLVFGVYLWRIEDLKKQRNKLQIAVDEGVKEISEQKNLIEGHARELFLQNETLKERNEQISEQKHQIGEMEEKVQRMTFDRISFFTNITHEFRTPITLIIGPIERALKLSSNPKVIEQLHFVEKNSKYLLSLVNQLMDFRKLESGKIEIVKASGDFCSFLEDIIIPFRAYAEERHIEIETYLHLNSTTFAFDHDALRKVLTNLIGNAIKFTPDNGVIKVYAALFKPDICDGDPRLYISVSDTGCGLQEGEDEKVFHRFYQGKSQMKYPLIGASDSGIGLYLCRQIVELYAGKIWAKNNQGDGATFRVLVPVPVASLGKMELRVSEINISRDNPENNSSRERLRILIVEDNSDMRAYMRSILSDRFDILEAQNGKEALKLLLTENVDLIISDLMMPEMDGLELANEVKGNFSISHIPFVMLTAKTNPESKLKGFRNGVDEFILKPFNEEMLIARIENILENKMRYQDHFRNAMEVDKLNIPKESRDKKFVDKVMEVVEKNYQNSYFDVGDFAEQLGVSRSLLNKKLNSLIGESANQLMRSFRMKKAKELILQNRDTKEMNISEIAFMVGFNDSKYFTRCFTKEYGMSPSAMLKDGDLSTNFP